MTIAQSPPAQRGARGGQLVLVDFGVAKQISGIFEQKTGTIAGTAGYAPIEQIRGGKAYPASDLYSLGVTCIHLLTGAELSDLFDPIEGEWIWLSYLAKQGVKVSNTLALILDKLLKDCVKERAQSAAIVLQQLAECGQYPSSQLFANCSAHNLQYNTASAIYVANLTHYIYANPTASNLSSIAQKWQYDRALNCHSGTVNSIAINPKGNILVTASDDKTIKLWNLQTGELIHTFSAIQRSLTLWLSVPTAECWLAAVSIVKLSNGSWINER
ncbi:MAG: hypothetical protein HC942_15340 [Microcoleus sp. SU_5_6]|nr:hypothetical protein [Microcoleus sp. SU_5_6]